LLYEAGRPVQVKDIARRQGIPEDFLGQLMVALRKAGLVESVRGPSGGYVLARPPAEITLAEAIETLEGPLGQTECATQETRSHCFAANFCAIQEAWKKATQAAIDVLSSITIEDICRRQRELSRALTYQI